MISSTMCPKITVSGCLCRMPEARGQADIGVQRSAPIDLLKLRKLPEIVWSAALSKLKIPELKALLVAHGATRKLYEPKSKLIVWAKVYFATLLQSFCDA